MCPFSENLANNKMFASKALKIAGYGTKLAENKIQTEIYELLNFVSQYQGKIVGKESVNAKIISLQWPYI